MSDTLTNSQNVSTGGGHGDDIITLIDHASPRPWRRMKLCDEEGFIVLDAKMRQIATMDEDAPEKNEANAALIVEAVNEYDGKHTFCTQDCVWMGTEIERLRNENARLKMGLEGMRALCNQQAERLKEPTEEDKK